MKIRDQIEAVAKGHRPADVLEAIDKIARGSDQRAGELERTKQRLRSKMFTYKDPAKQDQAARLIGKAKGRLAVRDSERAEAQRHAAGNRKMRTWESADVSETIKDFRTVYPDGRVVPMTPEQERAHFTPYGTPEKVGDVSGQPTTPEEWTGHVQKHLDAFRAVQTKHGHYGAGDTEPDWHFHDVLRNAVRGKPHKAPASSGGWEIFSEKSQQDPRFRGSSKAVRDLRTAAIAAYHAVRKGMKHKNPEVRRAVEKHVRDYAWRVDI